jgi:hypothetical protein
MKFYETHYEEYIQSIDQFNIHPELSKLFQKFPQNICHLENLIIHGPSGVGKYSQVLHLLKKYSHSLLKYDKKISAQTDKQTYVYRISDIHYEIDMSLLGCNSKVLWHEVFCQIIDIVSVKSEKVGVILCKNFHMIHTELLDIFYSYMQQYNHIHSNIKIVFFILTEHVSFIPNNILNCCEKISIGRPVKNDYIKMTHGSTPSPNSENFTGPTFIPDVGQRNNSESGDTVNTLHPLQQFIQRISNYRNSFTDVTWSEPECEARRSKAAGERLNSVDEVEGVEDNSDLLYTIPGVESVTSSNSLTHSTSSTEFSRSPPPYSAVLRLAPRMPSVNIINTMNKINHENIINGKEIRSFSLLDQNKEVPKDIFNIICNNIINAINDKDTLVFTTFRDTLYDILIYNLDAVECLWHILSYFIRSGHIKSADVTDILDKTYVFLRYYNNNYRPIYHLESMFFYIIIKIYGYNEL